MSPAPAEMGVPAPGITADAGGAGTNPPHEPVSETAPTRRRRARSRRPSGASKPSADTLRAAAEAPPPPVESPASVAVTVREVAPPPVVSQTEQPSGPLPELASRAELSSEEQQGLDDLAARLQITFRRPSLLREAMTHASWNNERGEPSGPGHDNERLEYLGDAVLELVVGEYLFRRFPGYDEGQLTQLRAALVNTMSLAKLAERLGLGETLLLGKGAAKTGARLLPSLQANCFEAMIGAIFLDQGYRVATRVFLQSIGDLSEWSDENHKGRLQEAAQLRLGATPSYRVTAIGGPGHRREYRAEAVVAGKVLAEGRGSTKQAAEQAAARLAVEGLTAPERGRPAAPARTARPASSAEPARVRRRVAEVAADRRAASRPPAAAAAERAPEPPRQRGLLHAIRAAAQGLVKRRAEPVPPPVAAATEPATTAAQRRNHRGHRGGRGRHRASPAPGSQPSGASPGSQASGASPGSQPTGASPSSRPAARRRRSRASGSPASGPPPVAPPPQ